MNRILLIAAVIAQALAVLLLSHYNMVILAVIVVLGPELVWWLVSGRTTDGLRRAVPRVIAGLSVAILIGLVPGATQTVAFMAPLAQIILAALYALWVILLPRWQPDEPAGLGVIAVSQILISTALFQTMGVWHWAPGVIVALTYVSSYAIAAWYLYGRQDPGAGVLAMAWALIAAEVSWVFSVWLVHYIILGGVLVIPQGAIITAGLGYCLANIYLARAKRKLSRRRLLEYVVIMAALTAIVIAGTRWNITS